MQQAPDSKAVFMLIDGHALAYRAYHAFPPLTAPSGELVNAVYGFSRILLTVLRDLHPEYLACSFDLPQPTFRHTQFADYKAQREEMPKDLQTQIERIKHVVNVMNIPTFAIEGYEADDVIGTLATKAPEVVDEVLIVTGDRDAFQLVTDRVHVYMPPRSKEAFYTDFGPTEVETKMGLRPDQIVDYKALCGDASDNIPGIKGIGDKTAVRLLQAFDNVDKLYETVRELSSRAESRDSLSEDQQKLLKPKVLENLTSGYESMVMSRTLATIDRNVPLILDMDCCVLKNYDKTGISRLFEELGFKSLISLLPSDTFEASVQQALF